MNIQKRIYSRFPDFAILKTVFLLISFVFYKKSWNKITGQKNKNSQGEPRTKSASGYEGEKANVHGRLPGLFRKKRKQYLNKKIKNRRTAAIPGNPGFIVEI